MGRNDGGGLPRPQQRHSKDCAGARDRCRPHPSTGWQPGEPLGWSAVHAKATLPMPSAQSTRRRPSSVEGSVGRHFRCSGASSGRRQCLRQLGAASSLPGCGGECSSADASGGCSCAGAGGAGERAGDVDGGGGASAMNLATLSLASKWLFVFSLAFQLRFL